LINLDKVNKTRSRKEPQSDNMFRIAAAQRPKRELAIHENVEFVAVEIVEELRRLIQQGNELKIISGQ
jgi:hypothetical protein